MKRLAKEPAREGQRRVGMEVAREILKRAKAHPQIGGAYIFPPFGNYRLVEELLG
jgi:hypothetical protein